jgi:uncharacterized damage-inducible protein DinB
MTPGGLVMRQPLPIDAVSVKIFRHYLTREYANEIRACLAALSEEEIWRDPNPAANSVGHLVLHLIGATRHLVVDGVGGDPFERDREAEFSGQERPLKSELLQGLDDVLASVARVLDAATAESLVEISDRTEFKVSHLQLLAGATTHFGYHTGQIVYATKTIKPGVFASGDLFRRASKSDFRP